MKTIHFMLFCGLFTALNSYAIEGQTFSCRPHDSYCQTSEVEIITDDNLNYGVFKINGSTKDIRFDLPLSEIRFEVTAPVKCEIEYQLNFENSSKETGFLVENYNVSVFNWENINNAESSREKQKEYENFWFNGYLLKSVTLNKANCQKIQARNITLDEMCYNSIGKNADLFFSKEEIRSLHSFISEYVYEAKKQIIIDETACAKSKNFSYTDPKLNISNAPTSKLLPMFFKISGIENVKTLLIENSDITDLSPLTKLQNLEELFVGGNPIYDLSPIEKMTNLETLWIWGTNITDFEPLRKLKKLSWLDVSSTSITNLDSIKDLKEMNTLFFSDTKVSDMSPLTGLSKLYTLDFNETLVSDITPLNGLKNLHYLIIANSPIKTFDSLNNLSSLQVLKISNDQEKAVKSKLILKAVTIYILQ